MRATPDRPGTTVHLPVDLMDAVIFDMDGVVTDTARVHARAWTLVFDRFLHDCSERTGVSLPGFTDRDYLDFVDGKPRYEGVESFLASRDLALPHGRPSDPPGYGSVCALGNLKDRRFEQAVEHRGATLFPSTVALLHALRSGQVRTAIISSSRQLHAVLAAAGGAELFDTSVDGVEAERLELPGKPDPAIFLEAAHRLGVTPARTVVVEDSLAGVEAGRRGGFLLVVGINRAHRADRDQQLRDHGADEVVDDLDAVDAPTGRRGGRR